MQIPLLADRTWTLSNANKQARKDNFVLSRALIKYYLGHPGCLVKEHHQGSIRRHLQKVEELQRPRHRPMAVHSNTNTENYF